MGRLFRDSVLRRDQGVQSKPVLKAVVDTRFKEMVLGLIRSAWKSPFSALSDRQLAAMFCCSAAVVLWWLRRNKAMRGRVVRGLKWTALMAVITFGAMCFVELNMRRQSRWIQRAFQWMEKRLFLHSQHHMEVQERRRKSEMDSMAVYRSVSSMSLRQRQSAGRSMGSSRAIDERDRASAYSKTLPSIGLWDRIKLRALREAHESRSELRDADNMRPGTSTSRQDRQSTPERRNRSAFL